MYAVQLRRIASGIAVLLALLVAWTLVSPTPAQVNSAPAIVQKAVEVSGPTEAQALVGGSLVSNKRGSSVYVRCSFKSERNALGTYDGRLYEGVGYNHESRRFCGDETDQFRSNADARCIRYSGPGYTDGYWKIKANYWYKVSDLAGVEVFDFYYGSPDKCAGRPYFTHDGPGGIPFNNDH